ncbi:hypothetical protein J2X85_004196 [Microbacterium trichothecenolyticum]|uniref:family 43 glycosylhydrolase n=1 Tax=Microbacterium trichothecenolyticum TaxID=69370 RepID=UPI00285D5C90|nr:family 43 glycosylhydrolase [Microbacterium trichothecenolyticum]MDR7187126.1 hypothetical protein [Microbacterium trichothecenolyticum]
MNLQRTTARAVAIGIALVLGGSLLAASPATAAPPPAEIEPSGQLPLTGNLNLHDPTVWKKGDTYFAAPSHRGIWTAPRLEGPWTNIGNVPTAQWAGSAVWAPHVQQIGDTTYYYYSTSTFGTNNSAIGLKTTTTPEIPSSYVDHGSAIVSSGSRSPENNTFNAIDAALEKDDAGNWWMVWGSHYDGMFIQELAPDMVTLLGGPKKVADRASERFPVDNPSFNRMEGPSVVKHGGWYYLLTAWDWCCRASGNDNTYKIVAGRSKTIDGPYVDKNGIDLAEGGGTIILNSRVAQDGVTPTGLYRSPGAPDYFREDGVLYLTYHAHRPGTVMGIRPFNWDDGWPLFYEPGGGAYDIRDGASYQLRMQAGIISDPNSLQNPTASTSCLDAAGARVVRSECDESMDQRWKLERDGNGFYAWRSLAGAADQCLTMTSLSGEVGTPVGLAACDRNDAQLWYFDDTGHGFHRLVGKTSNLALEVENTNGVVGSAIVGGFRRDGDHQAGNLTQAAKWPPQQWRLEMRADTTKPVVEITSPTSGEIDGNANSIVLAAGDAESGIDVVVANIYKDGALLKGTQSSPNGAVSASHTVDLSTVVSGGLPLGQYTLRYNTRDVAGNLSQTHQFPFTLTDKTKPQTSLISPTTAGPFSSLSVQVDATDNHGLSRVVANIYKNGTLVKSTQTAANGAKSASHTAKVTLPEGTYQIRYNSQDLAGHVSATREHTVTIDTTAPAATVKAGATETVGAKGTYSLVSFKLHDAGKVDKVTLNGVVKDLTNNVWSDVNFVKPGVFGAVAGANTLIVHDVAGNATSIQFTLE